MGMLKNSLKRLRDSIKGMRDANEIMIRYRISGRFKLSVPPLLYVGKASYDIRKRLESLPGVSKFEIDSDLGTLVVQYDDDVISESDLFVILDDLFTPMLADSSDSDYGELMRLQRKKRLKKFIFETGTVITLTYILYIHLKLMIRWFKSPFKYWAPLAALGFLVWSHRLVVSRRLGVNVG